MGTLTSEGAAILQCNDSPLGTLVARFIKITAIKASRLVNVQLP